MNDELQMTKEAPVETRPWQSASGPLRHSKFSIRHSPAWVQHFIHHLAPQGMAGFVLANGSMSSNLKPKTNHATKNSTNLINKLIEALISSH